MQVRFLKTLVYILSSLAFFSPVFSQSYYLYKQPRLVIGADAAQFRISFDDFDEIYANKWGASYGGFAGVKVYKSYYALFKYGQFKQNGKNGAYKDTDIMLNNAKWEEKWYKLGVRIHPPVNSKFSSYYGFGIGFFDIKEALDISIFDINAGLETDNETGSGFYLELGMDYFPVQFISIYGEFEISSGSYNGRPGFEATSIGGYRFSAGIAIYPF